MKTNLSKEEVRTAVMTLQECKEEIAKLYGFDNWDRIDFYMLDSQDQTAQRPYAEERLNDEVAELYASQFKSKSEAVGWIRPPEVSVGEQKEDLEYDLFRPAYKAADTDEYFRRGHHTSARKINNQQFYQLLKLIKENLRDNFTLTRKVSVGEEKKD